MSSFNKETVLLREKCFFANQYLSYETIWLNVAKVTGWASVIWLEKKPQAEGLVYWQLGQWVIHG